MCFVFVFLKATMFAKYELTLAQMHTLVFFAKHTKKYVVLMQIGMLMSFYTIQCHSIVETMHHLGFGNIIISYVGNEFCQYGINKRIVLR